jgi:hypothetical protein
MFVIEYYFASKSFATVREAFNNASPNKEVPNKTTVHRLLTTFWTHKVFVCDKCSSSDRTTEITDVQIPSSVSNASVGYDCKNSILPLVSLFCA